MARVCNPVGVYAPAKSKASKTSKPAPLRTKPPTQTKQNARAPTQIKHSLAHTNTKQTLGNRQWRVCNPVGVYAPVKNKASKKLKSAPTQNKSSTQTKQKNRAPTQIKRSLTHINTNQTLGNTQWRVCNLVGVHAPAKSKASNKSKSAPTQNKVIHANKAKRKPEHQPKSRTHSQTSTQTKHSATQWRVCNPVGVHAPAKSKPSKKSKSAPTQNKSPTQTIKQPQH